MSIAAALIAGCGALPLSSSKGQGDMPPTGEPGVMPQASALAARRISTNYKVVYSFGAYPDAEEPYANLTDVGGTLYGTTYGGGANSCATLHYNNLCGTVFSVTTSGTEKVLYNFKAARDASLPITGLIHVRGTLYGTTTGGGLYVCFGSYGGCGTVFSVTTSGTEKVLHSFGAAGDGELPAADLIDVKGTLYSTTNRGGAHNVGTVFSITTSGAENVLHSFGPGRLARYPGANLIDVGGTLYGTTGGGGAHKKGTVFRITPGGKVRVLHSFGNGTDGQDPEAGLIDVKGTLYGTTRTGGAYTCPYYGGCGTVFSITTSGTEKVLHNFGSGTDGSGPAASLIDVNGTLYGTTHLGGAGSRCSLGCGTVFSITTSGTEKVLHSFDGTDGNGPEASLIDVKGTLYGTTENGGAQGWGTVFALTP
jgi:uncharacterized repeat protein (TIGR03803 family)